MSKQVRNTDPAGRSVLQKRARRLGYCLEMTAFGWFQVFGIEDGRIAYGNGRGAPLIAVKEWLRTAPPWRRSVLDWTPAEKAEARRIVAEGFRLRAAEAKERAEIMRRGQAVRR